jgi:WD40 repeat protein
MNNIIEERYTEIAMMRGHIHAVSCLTLHENRLVSASMDKTIRIWTV